MQRLANPEYNIHKIFNDFDVLYSVLSEKQWGSGIIQPNLAVNRRFQPLIDIFKQYGWDRNDVVAHCRYESAFVSHTAKEPVEQRGDGGLSVCACHAHQFQAVGGVAVEGGGNLARYCLCVGYLHVGDARILLRGHCLAYNGCCSAVLGCLYILMAVYLCASDGYEQVAFLDGAGVYAYSFNVALFFG